MSYDIYLRGPTCPTCGHSDPGPDLPDPTYNLRAIFHRALTGEPPPKTGIGSIRLLDGKKAADTIDQLTAALARLLASEEQEALRDLEPKNRWGTLGDAVHVIDALLAAAREYPEHVWEVH